jgi:DNA-binding transcriptional ArsR family regulator
MSDEKSDRILEKLGDIEAILLLANSGPIQEAKKNLLKEGSEQSKIYELCQGKTTEEIAQAIGKTQDYVNTNLRRLREKGLVRSVSRKGKLIHEQRF